MTLTRSELDLRDPVPGAPFLDQPAAHPGTGDASVSRRFRAISVGLLASDAACAAVALVVAHLTLFGSALRPELRIVELGGSVACWVGSFHAFGLYRPRYLSAFEEFRRLIGATSVAISLVLVLRISAAAEAHRRWLGLTWLLALAFELGARWLWRRHIARLRRSGALAARTLVVGANGEAAELAAALAAPGSGFAVVARVDPGDDLAGLVPALGVETLFVAAGAVSSEQMVGIARVAGDAGIEVRTSAQLTDVLLSRLSVHNDDGLLALSLRPASMSPAQAAVKRSFDVILASLALLVLAPVFGVVAAAVRFSSPGPVFFRQPRVTKDGRQFDMVKFRTMVADAGTAAARREIDLTVPFFKMVDDPRITRVGRLLRKLSLDELPQLWQVVRGDLSLVGPRPLPADQVCANPHLAPRHRVRTGITGWWQVNGRSGVSPDEALRMDLFYIRNWSLSLDLFIMVKTFGTVLSNRGAC